MKKIDEALIKSILPKRSDGCDKRGFGELFCFTGSPDMPGAAVLSSRAAYRSGAGLVRVVSCEAVCRAVLSRTPECLISPMSCLDEYREFIGNGSLSRASALLFGCGAGVSRDSARLLKELLSSASSPIIIDADGLNILAAHPEYPEKCACTLVLTPHKRELARLLSGFNAESAEALCRKTGAVLVCKDAETQVFAPPSDGGAAGDCDIYILNKPNSALSKGGSGDVLAGIIASLACQGVPPTDAALCGVYLHSRAGELARRRLSAYSALPSDLTELLGEVFLSLAL